MMRRGKPAAWIMAAALAATPAIAAAESGAGGTVAKMGAIELKLADVRALLKREEATAPDRPVSAQALERIVRAELIRRAVLAEALKAHWDKRPEVAAAMAAASQQALVTGYMNDMARPPADYPDDAQIRAAYDGNREAFKSPAQVHLRQIFLAKAKGATARQADTVWKAAQDEGADFAQLARKYDTGEASPEGDLGWLPADRLVPEIQTAVAKLEDGAVSRPVETADGWHIVKLVGRKAAALRPLSAVKPAIVRALRLQMARQNERTYLGALLAKEPIVVDGIALSHMEGAKQ